jgi:Superinfection immunity protein
VHGLAAVAPSSAGISFVGVIFLLILLGAYFIPGIVASVRHVPNQASVWIINIFLGWTLVGWVVALAMAARSQLTAQQVIVQQGWQPGPGMPGQAPPPGFQPYDPQQPQQPWGQAQPQQPWTQGQ